MYEMSLSRLGQRNKAGLALRWSGPVWILTGQLVYSKYGELISKALTLCIHQGNKIKVDTWNNFSAVSRSAEPLPFNLTFYQWLKKQISNINVKWLWHTIKLLNFWVMLSAVWLGLFGPSTSNLQEEDFHIRFTWCPISGTRVQAQIWLLKARSAQQLHGPVSAKHRQLPNTELRGRRANVLPCFDGLKT